MPIYEYACKNCDHRMDALQKVSEEPLKDCPECGEPALKRLLSAPRFRLKGKGWYETDFKKDNQRNVLSGDDAPAKGKAADGDGKGKGDVGGASKAEPKTESKTESSTKKDKKASGGAS